MKMLQQMALLIMLLGAGSVYSADGGDSAVALGLQRIARKERTSQAVCKTWQASPGLISKYSRENRITMKKLCGDFWKDKAEGSKENQALVAVTEGTPASGGSIEGQEPSRAEAAVIDIAKKATPAKCKVAAVFGRGLDLLPDNYKAILCAKCSDYFAKNGHPQALLATCGEAQAQTILARQPKTGKAAKLEEAAQEYAQSATDAAERKFCEVAGGYGRTLSANTADGEALERVCACAQKDWWKKKHPRAYASIAERCEGNR